MRSLSELFKPSQARPLGEVCWPGVVLEPKMLFRDWASIEMELTCKKLGKNLENYVRF